jgi:hypothetical protein
VLKERKQLFPITMFLQNKTLNNNTIFGGRKRSIIRGLPLFAGALRNLNLAKSEGWLFVIISFSVPVERPQDVNKCLIMQPNEYIHSDCGSPHEAYVFIRWCSDVMDTSKYTLKHFMYFPFALICCLPALS